MGPRDRHNKSRISQRPLGLQSANWSGDKDGPEAAVALQVGDKAGGCGRGAEGDRNEDGREEGGREPLQPGACAARGRERDPNHRLDARGQLRIEAAPGLTAGARPARARQARQARRAAPPAAEVALYVTSGPAPAGWRTVADRPWRRWRSGRCSCHPRCTHAWRGHPGRPSLYPWSGTPRPGPRPSASRRARCASHGSTTSLRCVTRGRRERLWVGAEPAPWGPGLDGAGEMLGAGPGWAGPGWGGGRLPVGGAEALGGRGPRGGARGGAGSEPRTLSPAGRGRAAAPLPPGCAHAGGRGAREAQVSAVAQQGALLALSGPLPLPAPPLVPAPLLCLYHHGSLRVWPHHRLACL